MPTYIEMPKLSDTMTEGTLVKWRKQKGEKIVSGDIIAEVETDKATMEMEAFDPGRTEDLRRSAHGSSSGRGRGSARGGW
jgi:pyruvate dehydrogenase E2 component (dihydrolipoamide acetyltransferase)